MTDVDLVVIGAATAGFEAAVAAHGHGVERVVILEKAPFEEAGGNARFSHTGFRFPYSGPDEIRMFLPSVGRSELDDYVVEPYTVEEFGDDIERLSEGAADPGMSRTLARGANEALHWMRELGIRWTLNRAMPGPDGRRRVEKGMALQAGTGNEGGLAQLADWRRIADELGIGVVYGAAVCGLERTDDGIRVRVGGTGDATRSVHAPDVVLASGGFQASRRRRAERLGVRAAEMVVRGSRYDTGEVMDFALALGAARSGQWQGANVSPVDPALRNEDMGNRANRYSYQYGVMVNERGERFIDEAEASLAYTYARIGWAIAEQPNGTAYQIFDGRAQEYLKHYAYRYAEPTVADTVGELAVRLSIPGEVLTHTIAEFNAAVPESPPFDPSAEDGRATVGLVVPKSNWALRIEVPPFHAYPVTSGITFTYGGLRVDEHARVMDEDGEPIRGMYASGDILGIFSGNYPSGAGQTRNAVFGLAAGRHIARHR